MKKKKNKQDPQEVVRPGFHCEQEYARNLLGYPVIFLEGID